jgi:hypothetical protein
MGAKTDADRRAREAAMQIGDIVWSWAGRSSLVALLALPAWAAEQTRNWQVTFEVRTALGRLGGSSQDQITIVFSNTKAPGPLVLSPPRPVLGDDVVQEFSFSARDLAGDQPLSFTRRVRDLAFLDARYIRIVNTGSDGWAGEYISISVDKNRILDRRSLFPRQGRQKEGGIEKFNRGQWSDRVYWEAELQPLRLDRYKQAR